MDRRLEVELLDELPAADPRAARSRKDLHRLNAWMRNASIMTQALRAALNRQAPQRILEIGGGDGQFMLSVARKLGGNEAGVLRHENGGTLLGAKSSGLPHDNCSVVRATLLDKQNIVSTQTLDAFQAHHWRLEPVQANIFEWLEEPTSHFYNAVIANLFLHHFSEPQLLKLLHGIAKRAQVFVALEPRRSAWSLAFSQMAGLIGCNEVTRHDAVISVKAGFTGRELSRLWPTEQSWRLRERSAGLFSHLFIAQQSASREVG